MSIATCPNCGSQNVEELIASWFDANGGKERGESFRPELYSDLYWCRDCETHPRELIESEES